MSSGPTPMKATADNRFAPFFLGYRADAIPLQAWNPLSSPSSYVSWVLADMVLHCYKATAHCLVAADSAVRLVVVVVVISWVLLADLSETPYHGKHGARSDHFGSFEHCKHHAHYPAVYAEPEPAKAGQEVMAAR
ncbi:hypothetical protein UY3_04042 [Chelonia mydas]|uniref:Uncharacterized protein n=1 Tax=Chelonia mydas TaxID=8469 RepID=M7C2U1_CHEMY|nr:hypothetical protein UY3_04042 [Chelonia mydas]